MLTFKFLDESDRGDSGVRRRRRTAALVSLGVHLVLGVVLFIMISPLEIIVQERRVADIVIVDPPPIYLPNSSRSAAGRRPDPGVADPATAAISPGGKRDPAEPDTSSGDRGAGEASSFPSPRSKTAVLAAGRFRLAVPRVDSTTLPVGEGLILSPYAENPWFPTERSGERVPVIDLSRYSGWRPGAAVRAAAGPESGIPGRRGGVDVRGTAVDLGPWAEVAVAAVQENWFLTPGRRPAERGELEIMVRVGRAGQVTKMKVIRASGIESLDEAALKALRIAPFPALPDPFPDDELEIRLVFEVR